MGCARVEERVGCVRGDVCLKERSWILIDVGLVWNRPTEVSESGVISGPGTPANRT